MKIDIDTKQLNAKLNDAIDQGLHSLDQGLRRFEEVRDTLSSTLKERADDIQRRASHQWHEGRSKAVEAEKTVETHVRQHPGLYLVAGLGLIALVAAKVLLTRRRLSD